MWKWLGYQRSDFPAASSNYGATSLWLAADGNEASDEFEVTVRTAPVDGPAGLAHAGQAFLQRLDLPVPLV